MDRRAASAAALALRQAYRRDAALFLLSPASSAAAESGGVVGRALLLRSGREVLPVPPPLPSSKGRSQRGDAIGIANNGQLQQFRPGGDSCAPCGQPFFALPTTGKTDNTAAATTTTVRVRSLGRGRTRRRRASRIWARDIARRTASGKDRGGGRQWAAGSSGGVQQSSAWAGSGSVRDGTARHSVVYVCGNCGHRTRWGRHKRQRTQSEGREEDDTARVTKRQKRNGTARKGSTKKTATATVVGPGIPTSAAAGMSKNRERDQQPEGNGGGGRFGGDFVSLQPSPGRKRKNASSGADGGRKGGLGSGNGKGGSGKKSQKRKTKLLDFLSSLNG